jgi:hypothetical protein
LTVWFPPSLATISTPWFGHDLPGAARVAQVRVRRDHGLCIGDARHLDQPVPGVVDVLEDAVIGQVAVVVVAERDRAAVEVIADLDVVARIGDVAVGVVVVADLEIVVLVRRGGARGQAEESHLPGRPLIIDGRGVERGGVVREPGAGHIDVEA